MKNCSKLNQKIISTLITYLVAQGAKKIGLFGSYVQGEANEESDIDILVEFLDNKSLLELVRIERELSDLVHTKIDLVTERSVSPLLIDSIKAEEKVIYEN